MGNFIILRIRIGAYRRSLRRSAQEHPTVYHHPNSRDCRRLIREREIERNAVRANAVPSDTWAV